MKNNEINRYRTIGFTLLLLGFLVVIVSTLLFTIYGLIRINRVETGAAGCVIIFFIPICFIHGTPGILSFILIIIIIVTVLITLIVLINLLNLFIYRKSYIPT